MFRITQRQHAIQRAAVLEDLRIRSEQAGMTDSVRKQLHNGYADLAVYWTDINETEAAKFKVKALTYANHKTKDHHIRCVIL